MSLSSDLAKIFTSTQTPTTSPDIFHLESNYICDCKKNKNKFN